MKRFKLVSKGGDEAIRITMSRCYEDAVEYFSAIKNLPVDDLLFLFEIVPN